jgi:hypothetical protein
MSSEMTAKELLKAVVDAQGDFVGTRYARACRQMRLIERALRTAHAKGRAEMREEAARVCDRKAELTSSRDAALTYGRAADAIRNLPTGET